MSLTPLTRCVTRRLALAIAFVSLIGVLLFPSHLIGLPFIESAPTRDLADLSTPSRADRIARERVRNAYGQLPLSFEPNHGQTAPEVQFLARGSGYTLFLTSQEAVLSLRQSIAPTSPHLASASPAAVTAVAVRMKLLEANATPAAHGEEDLPGRSHYLIGNDPKQWRTDIVHYQKVKYEDVYPGVDLVYRGNQGQLEYDFIVNPGADPADISLAFDGVQEVGLDANGELVLSTGSEEIRQHRPVIYQDLNGVRTEITGGYQLEGGKVRFRVASYDERYPLVIDPILVYATYLGDTSVDAINGIAVDADGYAYMTGLTRSLGFPTDDATLQPLFGGGIDDAFVAKLNRDGTGLVYATYLGGGLGDYGSDIAVDDKGYAYLTGSTFSGDFPTTPGAFQPNFGSGFVTKLNRSGNALVYSTYLGTGALGLGIAIDIRGHAYVTGQVVSPDFPTTGNALQSRWGGSTDAFITQLDREGASLVYSTYLGGSGHDVGNDIAIDVSGHAYIAGYTDSADFPVTLAAFDQDLSGDNDGFVAKLNRRGTALAYATYLGGSFSPRGNEQAVGIAVDGRGSAYVTGLTDSIDFPITPGAPQPFLAGSADAFVTKLDWRGSRLVYSTYFGGSFDRSGSSASGADFGHAIAVDNDGHAYVTGQTGSLDLPITLSALQPTYGGGIDAFVASLDRRGETLLYASYLGGNTFDTGSSIALHEPARSHGVHVDRIVYVAGWTFSGDFPTTSGSFQSTYAGGNADGFVVKIRETDIVKRPRGKPLGR